MKVEIAYSKEFDSYKAGQLLVASATKNKGFTNPNLAFVFCSGYHDETKLFESAQYALGDVPIVGGSTPGIITNQMVAYDQPACAIALIEDEKLNFNIVYNDNIAKSEQQCGQELAKQCDQATMNDLLILLFDLVKAPMADKKPPTLFAATSMLNAIEDNLDPKIPIVGAGLVANRAFRVPTIFSGQTAANRRAVGVHLSNGPTIYTSIMHGCTLQDGNYHRVTKIDGSKLYEVDNKPVVDLINEKYGGETWQSRAMQNRLTLGVNLGDRWEFDESKYINRVILGPLPDKSAVLVYQPDLKEGLEFQFMLRGTQTLLASTVTNTQALFKRIKQEGKTPIWGFYVDCAGRTAKATELLYEEAEKVKEIFNENQTPLLGFYSGCELATLEGKPRVLDWTGVLTVFAY